MFISLPMCLSLCLEQMGANPLFPPLVKYEANLQEEFRMMISCTQVEDYYQ